MSVWKEHNGTEVLYEMKQLFLWFGLAFGGFWGFLFCLVDFFVLLGIFSLFVCFVGGGVVCC